MNAALTIESGLVTGPLFNEPMRVETVQPNGNHTWVLGLVGVQSEMNFDTKAQLQEPIKDLARFPWHEVKKAEQL